MTLTRNSPYRIAIIAAALAFHRHVLFYPDRLFPWDFRAVHLPLATLIAQAFRRGEFPLWDPFTYCGMPIFANIQAAVFYPPVLAATSAAAVLGDAYLPRLLAISVVLQIIFAGLCAFQLLRRLEAKPAAAWIGATVFELGCFFAAQAEHMGAMQGAVWLPLIWLSALEIQRFKSKWMVILVLSLAMTVLAGLPQVAVAAFLSAVCFTLLLVLFRLKTWRVGALTLVACAWALLVAAIQFLPTAELTQNSVAKFRGEWLGSGGGTPPGALLSLVIPNYWNVFDPSKFHGPTDLTFLYLYSSLGGLALAIGALLWITKLWKPRQWERLFAAMLAIFTLGMLGDQTLVGRALLLALPLQIRIGIHPEFLFCVFSLSLAILAGLGAERLLGSSRLQVAAGIVIVCDLLLVSSGRPMNEVSSGIEPGITHDTADGSSELVARIRQITERSIPPSRYDTRPDVSFLWSSTAPILGIPTGNGCDPLAPERTIEARRAFASGPRWGTCYQVENPASRVLSLMNTRVLLSHSEVNAAGLRLAGETAGYKIYENLDAMERFFFAKHVRSVENLAAAAAIVQARDFRPSEETVIEARSESLAVTAPAVDDAIKVASYASTAIQLATESSTPTFLVASDSYYPGWEATIDGNPTRIYPTDAAFRGVGVPAGKHTVDFRFVPRTLYRSAAISAVALVGLLMLSLL